MTFPIVSTAASGGAIRGANQAGGFLYLHDNNIRVEYAPGVSIGNINSAMFAQGDAEKCVDLWVKHIKSKKDIFVHWIPEIPYVRYITNPFSYAYGAAVGGFYNTSPIKGLIDDYIDPIKLAKADTRFIAVAVHKNTHKLVYVEATEETVSMIKAFIYASAAFPGAFQPMVWKFDDIILYNPFDRDDVTEIKRGDFFEDAGVQEVTPVEVAARMAKRSKHVIIMSATRPEKKRVELKRNIVSQAMNTLDNMMESIYKDDFRVGILCHWQKTERARKKFRHFKTMNYAQDSFDVNHDDIKQSVEDGYLEMERVCKRIKRG